MKKLILMLIAIATIACGCKKYEEGPCISFRSAKNRIYGAFTLKDYSVNGNDSINQYKDSLGTNFSFYYSSSSEVDVCLIDGIRNDGNDIPLICKWKLINENKVLYFYTSHGPKGVGPIGNSKTLEWDVLKLKNNEIKLKTFYNSKTYMVDLVAK